MFNVTLAPALPPPSGAPTGAIPPLPALAALPASLPSESLALVGPEPASATSSSASEYVQLFGAQAVDNATKNALEAPKFRCVFPYRKVANSDEASW
jgi:hypothetical protein